MGKKEFVVRAKLWSGQPYKTTEGGITTYHPGTEFGWKDMRTFHTLEEAETWLRVNHLGYGDYTIVAKEI